MQNCQEDLLILHDMCLKGKASKSGSIIQVLFNTPPPNWIKVNIDDTARGTLGIASFHICFQKL